MKKIVKVISLCAAGLMLFAFTNAPTDGGNFEGVITYTVKLGGDVPPQAASMMQNMSTKVYIKGTKSRSETNWGMGSVIVISDYSTKSMVRLQDMMGKKYEVKTDANTKKADDDKSDIKYLDDTKQIAGYTCKHAQVTATDKKGESNTADVYYTDQLPYSEDVGRYKGLKGFPLSFEMKRGTMNMYFTAQSVTSQSVPDSMFVVPATGYKVVGSDQEMMQDMQKSRGGDGE